MSEETVDTIKCLSLPKRRFFPSRMKLCKLCMVNMIRKYGSLPAIYGGSSIIICIGGE